MASAAACPSAQRHGDGVHEATTTASACRDSPSQRGKQLPVPLGDDFGGTVNHLDGGLIVDRVRRDWYPGGPLFNVVEGSVRKVLVIQVRIQREVDQPQCSVALQRHIAACRHVL